MLPLSLLNLPRNKRLLIAMLALLLGISGLWLSFPLLHNGASMILPIICFCWFFSYRGLLISLSSAFIANGLMYWYIMGDSFSHQAIAPRLVLGVSVVLLLGFMICWLRKATDLIQESRQQALTAEQERFLAIERERQLIIGYEQQRKINELKDQFLVNVSHELRTPLTILGGSLEMLKEYHDLLDPTKRTQILTQALTSQETLADLVNQALESTTVISEIPLAMPEAVSVRRLLQKTLAHLDAKEIEAYTICLHVSEQLTIRADPHLLCQVLQNILSNIFKYVPRQTTIHVETSQATLSSPVCLSIQDEGPGIPPAENPLLFEKFVRLNRDLAGTKRGMGLGLYICRRLVEAMEGHIWVESTGRPGEGCRFCLTLPPFSP